MRAAIAVHLLHRNSLGLSRQANRLVVDIEYLVSRAGGDPDLGIQIYTLYGECHFGFREALRDWPENEAARQGLRRAQLALLRFDLSSRDVRRARLRLAEIGDPPANLVAAVRSLERHEDAAARELVHLRRIERETDLSVGLLFRGRVMKGLGVLWGGIFALLAVLQRTGWFVPDHATVGALVLLHGAVLGAMGLRRWTDFASNEVNRRFLWALSFSFIGLMLLWPMVMYIGLDLRYSIALVDFDIATACVVAAVALDRRILVASAVLGLAFAASVIWPDAAFEVTSVGLFGAIYYIGHVWTRDHERRVSSGRRRADPAATPPRPR